VKAIKRIKIGKAKELAFDFVLDVTGYRRNINNEVIQQVHLYDKANRNM